MKIFSKVGTVFLCLWMIVLMFASQVIGASLFALLRTQLAPPDLIPSVFIDGLAVSMAMIFTLIVVLPTVIALIKWKIKRHSQNYSVFDYLAIKPFTWRVAIGLMGIWLLFLIGSEALTYLLDKDPTEFMDALYDSTHPKWLLIAVVVLVVPIYEELIFRGVLWSALSNQMQGQKGIWLASLVTSLLFALVHTQYGLYEISTIFILALILSLARYKSGSLLLPILIHIFNNAIAMWQYVYYS